MRAKKTDGPRKRAYMTTVEEDAEIDAYEEMLECQAQYREEMAFKALVEDPITMIV